MSLLSIVIIFAIELRLTIIGSVKVYKSRIVTIKGLISLSVIIISERLVRLSLLSGVSDYRSVNRLLTFTLYLSLVESVIDPHYELNILGKLIKAIYFNDFVFNIFFKALIELSDISVVILI